MSRVVCTVAGLIFLVASPPRVAEAGDEERRKWWESDRVRAEVGLTPDQSADLEGIFQATLPRLRAEKKELDRLEKEVSQLVASGTVDERQISQAVDRVEAARSQANKTRTLMLFRMYRVLSVEQRAKLKAYHERRERDRHSSSSREPDADE